MIEIFHNPRCGKSREGLQILEASEKAFKIIKYFDEPLSVDELQHIIQILNIKPIDLIRQKETIWKDHFKNKKLSDKKLIELMVEHPKLMERPIVVNYNKAIIGRPPVRILEII